MCRKNLVLAAALIAFGAGMIASLFIESLLFRLCLGTVSIAVGVGLLRGNC